MRFRAVQTLLRGGGLFRDYKASNNRCALTYSQLRSTRLFSSEKKDDFHADDAEKEGNLSSKTKYKVFQDEDSDVILDMYEERQVSLTDLEVEKQVVDPFEGLNLTRGERGVYDIEDLVAVLKREKARDVFVASVPPEYNYVDYMVLVSGKSTKHVDAMAQFVMKVFKRKRNPGDHIPKREGEEEWVAIDLGNIALHIFMTDTRKKYDLETLWSVGPEYDDQTQKPSVDIMDQYNAFLANFEPADQTDQEERKQ